MLSSQSEQYFSHQSDQYAAFRPEYPLEFLKRIADLTPRKHLAWDCGTGNGQCARNLKTFFDEVVATDISPEQLRQAVQAPGVTFRQAPAEKCPLADGSVDLVTVAGAVHWFDIPRFYAEVNRIVRPGGVVAVWTYFMPQIENVDGPIRKYFGELLLPYYSPETALYRNEYRDLDFPFREIRMEGGTIKGSWSGEQLLGFMGTWSARMACLRQGAPDPLDAIIPEVRAAWGDMRTRKDVQIPLYARIGVVGA